MSLYYNSGVLLMDLEAWRNQDVLGQLLNFTGFIRAAFLPVTRIP